MIAAAVGGDDIKALRQQVVQTKLDRAYAWINNQQDWPDVYGLDKAFSNVAHQCADAIASACAWLRATRRQAIRVAIRPRRRGKLVRISNGVSLVGASALAGTSSSPNH